MSGQQTQDASNFTDASFFVSINGAAEIDICGEASSLNVSGGDRDTAEFFPACGDTPIILTGKRKSNKLAQKIAYTEGLSDTRAIAQQAYVSKKTVFQVRWVPRGAVSGNLQYVTDPVYSFLTSPPFPDGDVGAAAPTELTLNISTSSVTPSVIP